MKRELTCKERDLLYEELKAHLETFKDELENHFPFVVAGNMACRIASAIKDGEEKTEYIIKDYGVVNVGTLTYYRSNNTIVYDFKNGTYATYPVTCLKEIVKE